MALEDFISESLTVITAINDFICILFFLYVKVAVDET